MATKCVVVALIGAPNSGKSTLLNKLIGSKVSIVSPKAQTTRTRVVGICEKGPTQIIFIDTPGVFEPTRRIGRAMVAAAWSGALGADKIVLLVDANNLFESDTKIILNKFQDKKLRADLVLNKIDLVEKSKLLECSSSLNKSNLFDHTFMISAKNGEGVETLMKYLVKLAPVGSWLYPKSQASTLSDRQFAAEITREKIFLQLHREVPYAIIVETEDWKVLKDGSIRIQQVVYVKRKSHKSIILGKNGHQIKSIGSEARKELRENYDCNIHLMIHVKVRRNWEDNPEHYREWGLDFHA